jgi:beta-glucanase (GH16 family)
MLRRPLVLATALAALVALAGTPIAPAEPAAASGRLVWSDEFSGARGSMPRASNWTAEIGNGQWGWGNQQLEYNTSSAAKLDGSGKLVITASKKRTGTTCWNGRECRYTSARLTTHNKVSVTTGTVSARIKLPKGVGLWPAFWMLGTSSKPWPAKGEIDIMEWIGSKKNTVYGTVHGPGYSAGNSIGASAHLPADGKFHVYAVTKKRNEIRWFVDGKQFLRLTPADLPRGERWVFNGPFYLILDLAVGGIWPGSPNSSTRFPQKLVVDYVRIRSTTTAP